MKKELFVKIGFSSTLALLTGLGMMPIFDDDINSLTTDGLDWEDNEYISPIIAINTLAIFTLLANYVYLSYLTEESDVDIVENKPGKLALTLAKFVAICAAISPVSQLWVVELDNQEYVGSSGFDQYIAWATVTSLPILAHESMTCYSSLKAQLRDNLNHIDLNSVGDNIFVYTPTLLSIPGRFISYYYSTYFLAKEIGIPEELSIATGILVGGVIGSAVLGVAEYRALKSLFEQKEEPIGKLKTLFGVMCALEGVILTLPMVATGMSAIEDQPALIKGVLYSPLFISNTVFRGSSIYEAVVGTYDFMNSYFCLDNDKIENNTTLPINIAGDVYEIID